MVIRDVSAWKGELSVSYSFILRSASDFTGKADTPCWLSGLKPKPGPWSASTSDFLEGEILIKENEYLVPDSAVHKNKQVVLVIYTGLCAKSTASIYWFKAEVFNQLGRFSFPNSCAAANYSLVTVTRSSCAHYPPVTGDVLRSQRMWEPITIKNDIRRVFRSLVLFQKCKIRINSICKHEIPPWWDLYEGRLQFSLPPAYTNSSFL